MGVVSMGIPQQVTLRLANLVGAQTFVETGTYQGGTTRWAAENFKFVHTIERSKVIYDRYSPELSKFPTVRTHFGNSKDVLPGLLVEIGSDPAVVWLDGHWSGGETAGEDDECPVIEELRALAPRGNDIVMIDDARLFLCAPPKPHKYEQWPTIQDVINALPHQGAKHFIQVIDDVVFIVPDDEALRIELVRYAQERAEASDPGGSRFSLKSFFKK